MTPEDELRLRFETFVFYQENTQCDELDRLKKANAYFFENKSSLTSMCKMILKIQAEMYKALPPTKNNWHQHQFNRMNNLIKDIKLILKNNDSTIEKQLQENT